MAYRFKQGRPLEREVRRIADKQLALAIAKARAIGGPRNLAAIHEARRHVKRVRALIRLVRPALGGAYRGANRRLRAVSRALAPIANGDAVVGALARFGKKYRHELPRRPFVSMRRALVQRIDRPARVDQRSARLLEALDGCLGEYHNVALLQAALLTEMPLPRPELAHALRLLRKHQAELRREALSLGAEIYAETPRQFVTLARRSWRSANRGAEHGSQVMEKVPCARAA
jgi:hypothetical protein